VTSRDGPRVHDDTCAGHRGASCTGFELAGFIRCKVEIAYLCIWHSVQCEPKGWTCGVWHAVMWRRGAVATIKCLVCCAGADASAAMPCIVHNVYQAHKSVVSAPSSEGVRRSGNVTIHVMSPVGVTLVYGSVSTHQ
jgi:hypothetical protein